MKYESSLYFYGDDLVQRGIYAQNIKKIIKDCQTFPKSNDNRSYVIGVNAPWGSGKTYFMRMLKSYLEGKWEKPGLNDTEKEQAKSGTGVEVPPEDTVIKYKVIYYDAWKNDFWNNAFEPLFDNLIVSAPVSTKAEEKDIAELGKTAAQIIALGIKGFVAKKIEDVFDPSAIDDINKKIKEFCKNAGNNDYQTIETFPDYALFKSAIDSLREYLTEAVKENEKLVIIIDELDRCKPTFAVQTLEIVKHLFNIEGLVFIFALDISQLSHSVKVVYGNDFDAIGYLERFFNYLTILPHGRLSSEEQAEQLIKRMGLEGAFSKFNNKLIQRFIQITDLYSLTLREVKTVLIAYSILLNTVLVPYSACPDAIILYFYFLCMKYKKPILLSDGVFKNQSKAVREFIYDHHIPFIECDNNYYQTAFDTLTTNESIAKLRFNLLKNGKKQLDRFNSELKFQVNEVTETIVTDTGDLPLHVGISLSSLLFFPDILRFNKIKNYTLLEYIYRQIEMCDFIREEETSEQ